MTLTTVLLLALVIGLVCGLRSMTGPAIICWGAHLGWLELHHSRLSFLHSTIALIVFFLLALGELVADKLANIPGRNQPGPLAVRFLSGALCGSALCITAAMAVLPGALLGGLGGVAGGLLGYHVRRWLTHERHLPDLPVALTEDVITICVGLFTVSRFVSIVHTQDFYYFVK
ncbi:MAG TPA: DUF4126 family protein [Acidisarcina sp.]